MKNLLKLHEAMVIALISKSDRSGTFEEIADYIEKRNLFPNRDGGIGLSKQVMLRATQSKKSYAYLFQSVDKNTIRLRDSKNGDIS